MIDFLNDSFDVPVNAVLFQPFEGGLLGRTWLRPDVVGARIIGEALGGECGAAGAGETVLGSLAAHRPQGPRRHHAPCQRAELFVDRPKDHSRYPGEDRVIVRSSFAYAEVQFDDDDPQFQRLASERSRTPTAEIESAYGTELDWRGLASNAQQTKRTKIVAPQLASAT